MSFLIDFSLPILSPHLFYLGEFDIYLPTLHLLFSSILNVVANSPDIYFWIAECRCHEALKGR